MWWWAWLSFDPGNLIFGTFYDCESECQAICRSSYDPSVLVATTCEWLAVSSDDLRGPIYITSEHLWLFYTSEPCSELFILRIFLVLTCILYSFFVFCNVLFISFRLFLVFRLQPISIPVHYTIPQKNTVPLRFHTPLALRHLVTSFPFDLRTPA